MNYFVTAINTDSGKTLVSAIMCQALRADYWKPVQAGTPTDSDTIQRLSDRTVIHPETYRLKTPASPHAAAKIDNITITMDEFRLPLSGNDIVIEGAGGCLVPLNDQHFIIDIASKFDCEIVLVSNLYLGSINHTLLTFEALQKRNLKIKGIVFNGLTNPDSENIILHHTKLPCLLRIAPEKEITPELVEKYANQFNDRLKKL